MAEESDASACCGLHLTQAGGQNATPLGQKHPFCSSVCAFGSSAPAFPQPDLPYSILWDRQGKQKVAISGHEQGPCY